MTEFTRSYASFRGTFLRTVIYTIGHFFIAASTTMYFTGADFYTALTNAIVEPILNAVWYFVLDAIWIRKVAKPQE